MSVVSAVPPVTQEHTRLAFFLLPRRRERELSCSLSCTMWLWEGELRVNAFETRMVACASLCVLIEILDSSAVVRYSVPVMFSNRFVQKVWLYFQKPNAVCTTGEVCVLGSRRLTLHQRLARIEHYANSLSEGLGEAQIRKQGSFHVEEG